MILFSKLIYLLCIIYYIIYFIFKNIIRYFSIYNLFLFYSYNNPNGEPEVFHLGTLASIPAWDLSLVDMCVGEKRKLIVPSEYGFGSYGSSKWATSCVF